MKEVTLGLIRLKPLEALMLEYRVTARELVVWGYARHEQGFLVLTDEGRRMVDGMARDRGAPPISEIPQ